MKHKQLTVDFGTPVDGWLNVRIQIQNALIEVELADGLDSLTVLVKALNAFKVNGLNFEIPWPNEPGYYVWKIQSENTKVKFSIEDPEMKIFSIVLNIEEFYSIFVKALESLELDDVWEKNKKLEYWSCPFPHNEFQKLKGR